MRNAESSPGFALVLLNLVGSQAQPQTVRLSSALYFKNLIKRNWVVSSYCPYQIHTFFHLTVFLQDENGNHQLPPDQVSTIKRELVGLMTASSPSVQAQLGEAISAIADSDFFQQWDTLINVSFFPLSLTIRHI